MEKGLHLECLKSVSVDLAWLQVWATFSGETMKESLPQVWKPVGLLSVLSKDLGLNSNSIFTAVFWK